MTQSERRLYLISQLKSENAQYSDLQIPRGESEQKILLRGLLNIRMPKATSDEFIKIQNEYLTAEIEKNGITDIANLTPIDGDIYLWQGDITTLKCGAIVNAANSQMLGCFCPNHNCIDNAIHTFSGVQLRSACNDIMTKKRTLQKTGTCEITPSFNLPCDFVIHTVGPIIRGSVRKKDRELLADCYKSCLETAVKHKIKSIAFCCISTGEFCFPNEQAAEIAVETVKNFKNENNSNIKVIFNVFKQKDFDIYSKILSSDR